MKHLKTYRLFESNLHYKEITSEEYDTLVSGVSNPEYDNWNDADYTFYDETRFIDENWEPFTQQELKKIQELLPDADYCKRIKTNRNEARVDSESSGLIMIKLKDDWYYAFLEMSEQEEDNLYFECDQFEGLIQFIKDYL